MNGSDLISSFYNTSSTGQGFASQTTELEFGVDVQAPEEGVSGFTFPVQHTIKHVFMNGVKLRYGADNDYVVDTDTNSLVMSSEWTLYTQDKLLITS